jgi:hypothetical protein
VPIIPVDVLTADGDNLLTADGDQIAVRGDPVVNPALFGIARFGAARFGASGTEAFIVIDGVDRTDDVDWRTVAWTESTGGEPDSVSFNMKHDPGSPVPRPDSSVGTVENVEFLGNVGTIGVSNASPTADESARRYQVTANGPERSLNARYVNGRFTGSASDVVAQIIALHAPGFTTNGVDLGAPVVGEMTFKFNRVTTALDRVAERVGWFWQLEGTDVKFYQEATFLPSAAPVLEGVWGWYRDSLRVGLDITQQRNRVFIEGRGSQLQAVVQPGDTIVPVTDGDNFQQLVDVQVNGGYLNGLTLMETTRMGGWTTTGAPTVTAATPPLNEGSNADAVRIEGTSSDYISETLTGHVDGPGVFSVLVQDPEIAGSGRGVIVIRDTTAAVTLVNVVVDLTDPANPTATANVGAVHRQPVRFTAAGATGVWYWFVVRTDATDMVAANTTEFRLYASSSATPGAIEFFGPMAQNATAPEYQYSWFVPVDFFFLPSSGTTEPLRERELAYLEDEFIAYRFMYSGELLIENLVTWSYALENWTPDTRTVVTQDLDVDEDGNLTLERIAWDNTGSPAAQNDVGVLSSAVVVPDSGIEGAVPGAFTFKINATDLGVNNTGFCYFGFYDPSTGTDLVDATQKVWMSVDLTNGTLINSGTGTGFFNDTATTEIYTYTPGKQEIAVAGTLTGGFDWGDQVQFGIYPAKADGTPGIASSVDGDYINAGHCLGKRGIGTVLSDYPTIETAAEPIFLASNVDALFGVPGAGRILSIVRRHGDGSDIHPILVQEQQASQLNRAEILAGIGNEPQWLQDGVVEFYRRDRRLSAEGMLAAANLELTRWLGDPTNNYSIPSATYTTRDALARAGAPVTIDVPTGWGISNYKATIVTVTTTWLKKGMQQKAVQVALVTPRSFYTYLRDVKREAVEAIE